MAHNLFLIPIVADNCGLIGVMHDPCDAILIMAHFTWKKRRKKEIKERENGL